LTPLSNCFCRPGKKLSYQPTILYHQLNSWLRHWLELDVASGCPTAHQFITDDAGVTAAVAAAAAALFGGVWQRDATRKQSIDGRQRRSPD